MRIFKQNTFRILSNIFDNYFQKYFYLYNVILINKINKDITKINVCGNIAPNGEFVED